MQRSDLFDLRGGWPSLPTSAVLPASSCKHAAVMTGLADSRRRRPFLRPQPAPSARRAAFVHKIRIFCPHRKATLLGGLRKVGELVVWRCPPTLIDRWPLTSDTDDGCGRVDVGEPQSLPLLISGGQVTHAAKSLPHWLPLLYAGTVCPCVSPDWKPRSCVLHAGRTSPPPHCQIYIIRHLCPRSSSSSFSMRCAVRRGHRPMTTQQSQSSNARGKKCKRRHSVRAQVQARTVGVLCSVRCARALTVVCVL